MSKTDKHRKRKARSRQKQIERAAERQDVATDVSERGYRADLQKVTVEALEREGYEFRNGAITRAFSKPTWQRLSSATLKKPAVIGPDEAWAMSQISRTYELGSHPGIKGSSLEPRSPGTSAVSMAHAVQLISLRSKWYAWRDLCIERGLRWQLVDRLLDGHGQVEACKMVHISPTNERFTLEINAVLGLYMLADGRIIEGDEELIREIRETG